MLVAPQTCCFSYGQIKHSDTQVQVAKKKRKKAKQNYPLKKIFSVVVFKIEFPARIDIPLRRNWYIKCH